MDAELLELQRQFEFAQQAKSSVRLSERNVVELVHKLQELGIINFELLHTVSGKEYITPDQLKLEIEGEVRKCGRVSLIDLADNVGVDLFHVEKQSRQIVSSDSILMLIQGEIIAQSYWDAVAEEINERLRECSHIALAELATQLHVGSELLTSVLEPRLGNLVKGRLEGGQLYTPAYIARINAMVRGASRGITVPTNMSAVWSSLQQLLTETDGSSGVSVESVFFQSIFNGVIKEGEILGSLRAGVHWTPAVFAHAQRESVDSFFSQNSFISYDILHKLSISQPKQYLQSRYPEGIPLGTVFVHASVIEMLDSAMEDAIDRGSWIDCLSILPAIYGSQDASKLLLMCPSVQKAVKVKFAYHVIFSYTKFLRLFAVQSSAAIILGDSCVLSTSFIKDVFGCLDKETETLASIKASNGKARSGSERKVGNDSGQSLEMDESIEHQSSGKQAFEKAAKKKKGKASGASRMRGAEDDSDIQEGLPSKSKKSSRKQKDSSSILPSEAKLSSRKDTDKQKDEILSLMTEEWIMEKILLFFPDFESVGDGPETVISALSAHLRPLLLTSWIERRKSLFTENADKMKRLLDNLQKKLDEDFFNMQLYEKALDLFDDDPSTSAILHRHLLRTIASSMVDYLLSNLDLDNKLKNGVQLDLSEFLEPSSLTSSERHSLAKSLPGSLSLKVVALLEALDGKRVDTFVNALRAVTEESGLILKKLDKKLERTLLHAYRKDMLSGVTSETDPVSLLPKVVSLLYVQIYNKALQAPGRAISVSVSKLKDKLEDPVYQILMDYHASTVSLLALQSSSTGDEADSSSEQIMSKKEHLESLMPELKSIVLNNTHAQ